jgi:hypothetical protein
MVAITKLDITRIVEPVPEKEPGVPSRARLPIRLIEFHVAHHCNLTCANCAHFSPHATRQDISVSNLDPELAAAARSFVPQNIQILGGEPLLNNRLPELVPLFRHYFPEASINLITNGTLLLKVPIVLFQALHASGVGIVVSRYPSVQLDLRAIQQRCEEFGVSLQYWQQDTFVEFLDPSGTADPVAARANCPMEGCNNIRDGRIFPCPVAAWADLGGLPFNPADGLPLVSPIEQLRAILNHDRITSACRYCRVGAKFQPHKMVTRPKHSSGELYRINSSHS